MKKLGLLFLVVSLGLLPFKTSALYKVDDDGNTIEYEGKTEEYHILVTEDEESQVPDQVEGSVGEGNESSVDPDEANDLDKSVTNTDADDVEPITDSLDDVYATDARLYMENDTVEANETSNIVLYTVGSGILGISIGALGVYLLTRKH